ncbi:MAG: hypothetical protein WKF80_00040 [Thermomicrobiales bacterium]
MIERDDVEQDDPGRDSAQWDAGAELAFLDAVRRERLVITRARFAGGDPTVVGPARKVAAKLLAADREAAMVKVGDAHVNPSEDRADLALQIAIPAISRWQFDRARLSLAEVTTFARSPVRLQRASAARAVLGVARAVVRVAPGGSPRGVDRSADSLIRRLDRLSDGERDHHRDEVARLVAHWVGSASDDATWRAWALLRGRLALPELGGEAAMSWAIRVWDRRPEPEAAVDPALAALIDDARATFAPLAGINP